MAAHDVRAGEVVPHRGLNAVSAPAELAGSGRPLCSVLMPLTLAPAGTGRDDELCLSDMLVVRVEGQENFSANCFARASAVASAI